MIITIDGPAGAGKSSVAKLLAKRLGFRFLDTGAMYRAVALAGMRKGLDWDVPGDLAKLGKEIELRMENERIFLDGEDVSEAIRTTEVTVVPTTVLPDLMASLMAFIWRRCLPQY
jgi:cytidylate kinase